jgi:hypothetical protein
MTDPQSGVAIDFTSATNNLEVSDGLAALKDQLLRSGVDPSVISYVTQAIRECNMPEPSKATILDHLESATEVVEAQGAGETSGHVLGKLASAREAVQRIY